MTESKMQVLASEGMETVYLPAVFESVLRRLEAIRAQKTGAFRGSRLRVPANRICPVRVGDVITIPDEAAHAEQTRRPSVERISILAG